MKSLSVTSDAFENGGTIPPRFTCDGLNINPSLLVHEIPEKTKSLALIVDDPGAASGTWVHWVVWNIPVSNRIIEQSVPGNEGMNDFGKHHYGGPCPPSGTHQYFFKVFALDAELQLISASTKFDLERAMKPHILASGELMGIYKRT